MLCYVMLCYVMLCYVILYYIILYYITLYLIILFITFSRSAAQRGLWPPRTRGFLITHNNAPQSVGILWTSDQLIAQHTHQTNIQAPGGIRNHDSRRRAALILDTPGK
jgi:hypothetical protein